jgi:hypothetical protein
VPPFSVAAAVPNRNKEGSGRDYHWRMMTHMLVQYLVGLCCLRANPDAVQIDLGDMVLDPAAGKERDVDVTVTFSDDNGEVWAFEAFEVKDEKSPLDVTVVEQLYAKLNDMPSVTHRAIVSSSGFTDGARSKAEYHGVELYVLERWATPVESEFPNLGLKGRPKEAIRFSRPLLVWLRQEFYTFAPSAGEEFQLKLTDNPRSSTGAVHDRYKTFDQYYEELLFRSTEILLHLNPARAMMSALPELGEADLAYTSEWPYGHTMDVSADEVYVKLRNLAKIEQISITGFLRWQRSREEPDFRVMRRVGDGQPFAGALIATGPREGKMTAFVMSDSPDIGIHFVQLEEKQQRMIRQLRLWPEASES